MIVQLIVRMAHATHHDGYLHYRIEFNLDDMMGCTNGGDDGDEHGQ